MSTNAQTSASLMPDQISSSAEISERSLVRAVARGDDAAAGELFRVYGEPVLRFVYRRVGEQREDAEEITLDTFASAVKLAPTYDPRASVFTWLCGIAKLRIIDHFRKTGRNKRIPNEARERFDESLLTGTLDDVLERMEIERVVDELLSTLTPDERDALLMRYVEQLSVREISVVMNRSEKGVEALLTRAKNKPRAQIERWRTGGAL